MKSNRKQSKYKVIFAASAMVGAILWGIPSSYAAGSSARGGGDPLALEFKVTAAQAIQKLQGMTQIPLQSVNLSVLQQKVNTAEVLVSDSKLPVSSGGVIQDGAAENEPGQNLIILDRSRYAAIASRKVKEALALHEFLSLLGQESTGNYPISGQFLIALSSGSSSSAAEQIGSASSAIGSRTPCPPATGDASGLFTLFATPNTSYQTVQAYLKNHSVDSGALNAQCRTLFFAAIEAQNEGAFQALYEKYQPNLNIPNTASDTADSIYSDVLEHGNVDTLTYLQKVAKASGIIFDLNPVVIARQGQNIVAAQGMTDLMDAASATTSPQMIQALIASGSQFNAIDFDKRNALAYAVSSNPNPAITAALVKAGLSATTTALRGVTPLTIASASNSNPEVLKILIQNGAVVNPADAATYFPPLMAAGSNNNPAIVETLIQAGADVNVVSLDGETPIGAMETDYSGVEVAALLKAGANPNGSPSQQSPLFTVLIQGRTQDALELIAAKADLNAARLYGSSVLQYAITSQDDLSVIQALIDAGANVNYADSANNCSSQSAAEAVVSNDCHSKRFTINTDYDPVSAMKMLIKAGADVNAKDSNGNSAWTQFFYTFGAGLDANTIYEMTQLLLQSGAKVNQADNQGNTALIDFANGFSIASYSQDADVYLRTAELLVKAGANLNAENSGGRNAYTTAWRAGASQALLTILQPH